MAAVPLVAHGNQFKGQQAERVRCVLSGRVPPPYDEIDHASAEVYQGYLAQPPDAVLAECRRVSAELIDGTWAVSDEDLLACPTRPACSMPLTSEEAGIGMAGCNLACAQAQAGRPDQAARTPAEAIEANPDLRPTPTATPTCGSFGKFPPEDGPAGSLGVDRHPSEGVLCSTPPASASPTCRTR